MEIQDSTGVNQLPDRKRRSDSLTYFLLGAAAAMLLGLGLFYLIMRPPASDLQLMVVLMGATTLFSIAVFYTAYRAGWIFRSSRLRLTLIGGYLTAGLLAFVNVWVAARMMFTSQHDLQLATILLVFASCMAVAAGFFLSEGIVVRIQQLQTAARQVADGELNARLPVRGRDEMAQLTRSFNDMVSRLEEADQQKRELDVLRRDLIAWVGHDLRTPLTSVRAIIEALADGLVDEEAQRLRYLRTAQADIRALSGLIDDLFEMAQMDAGGLQLDVGSVSIGDLISDTLEQFSFQAQQSGVTLEGSSWPGMDLVVLDVQRFGRVVGNLVSNALRHTPPGGVVTITAEREGIDLVLRVRDSGEGIRADDIPHVFERFYRGEKSRSRATGGSGLGLAIAKGIVELHGGTIGITSEANGGTEVWLRIPQ